MGGRGSARARDGGLRGVRAVVNEFVTLPQGVPRAPGSGIGIAVEECRGRRGRWC